MKLMIFLITLNNRITIKNCIKLVLIIIINIIVDKLNDYADYELDKIVPDRIERLKT
jgi:hypothetical protein